MRVRRVQVTLTLDPTPDLVFYDNLDWIELPHCGRFQVEGDTLVAFGDPEPGLTAVGLVHYGGWGSMFSGGGSAELEVDLSGGPSTVVAALRPDRALYDLGADDPDTGVPGGEQTWWYDPNGFPSEVIAEELHARLPDLDLPIAWRPPQLCQ